MVCTLHIHVPPLVVYMINALASTCLSTVIIILYALSVQLLKKHARSQEEKMKR